MATSEGAGTSVTIGRGRLNFALPLLHWFARHKEKLWWLHSFYALLLGIGFMWLGTKNFLFLRLAVYHIGFIWLSSLFLPKLLSHPGLPPRWAPGIRLLFNFLNKNLYQQMLFFVLPIYYASATFGSRNMLFVLLVALSAILSTLDIVYDRYLSARRGLTALFFAFNLFALINVMLPVLWSVSNSLAMRISALLALLAFLTLNYPRSQAKSARIALAIAVSVSLLGLAELGRPYIPPAPLHMASVEFGTAFVRESMRVESPIVKLEPARSLRLFGLTAIKAPLGLKERVHHRWHLDEKLVCSSPFYTITGGREEGFRFWTRCDLEAIGPRAMLRLDLETEGGQLIGRAFLRAS